MSKKVKLQINSKNRFNMLIFRLFGPLILISLAALSFDSRAASDNATNGAVKLVIVKAAFGDLSNPSATVDVTAAVSAMVKNGVLDMQVNAGTFEGGSDNVVNQLSVDYLLNGMAGNRTVSEGARLMISDKSSRLVIRKAIYGDLPNGGSRDVTADLAVMVGEDGLETTVGNDEFGDPATGRPKQLRVDYLVDGVEGSQIVSEGKELRISTSDRPGAPSALVIRKAIYGDLPAGGVTDVTTVLATMVSKNALEVEASDDQFGDPAPAKRKRLEVDYLMNGVEGSRIVSEGEVLKISANDKPSPPFTLVIRKAIYGDLPNGGTKDVTAVLGMLAKEGRIELTADNDEFGDPAPSKQKCLAVDYVRNGVEGSRTVPERCRLRLSAFPSKLIIRNAQYVALPHGKTNDVTEVLNSMIWDDGIDIKVSNNDFGDPAPFTIKQLRLDYEADGVLISKNLFEGARLRISAHDEPPKIPRHKSTRLVVNEARYGDLPDGIYNDVTETVESMVCDDALEVTADSDIFGDPAPAKKKLQVDFTFQGKKKSKTIQEGQVLRISASGEVRP